MENSLLQKRPDLKSYYNMAQEAFQENDIEEALKISKNGLKQAKLQNSGEWVDKFNSLNTNFFQEQSNSITPRQNNSLISTIKKEDIKIVKGIGPKVAEKLNEIGVETISDLVHAAPERIARISGVGLLSAQKLISNAKEHMRMKKLNDFSESANSVETLDITEDSESLNETDMIEEESQEPVSSNSTEYDHSKSVEQYLEYVEIDQQDDIDRNDEDNSFQEQTENNETTTPPISSLPIVVPPEAVRQSDIALQEINSSSQEIFSSVQIKDYIQQIAYKLKLSDFSIIERVPKLRAIFTGIDLLAIKHVRVKEFLDLIYIIPIKICSLKGSVVVSDDNVQYNPLNQSKTSNFQLEKIAQSYFKALSNVKMAIQSNLTTEGRMLQYISRYLSQNINLEKSITRKNLFFRSGPLQYKILIEPLLVCQNSVGFTEKLIPFAYQRTSNIHIVEHSNFSDLLHFLDQKYFFIELYSEQKSALVLDCEATNKFMKDLRKYSAPFMAFGVVMLFVILSQAYLALLLLINLGYGVALLYIAMLTYLLFKRYKEKLKLSHEFSTPYHQKKLDFEEGTLLLIKEELSSKLMDQFVYECIGKDSRYNFLNKLETENAERFLEERVQNKKIEQSRIFEPDIHTNPESVARFTQRKEDNPKMNDKYVNKYQSFLED